MSAQPKQLADGSLTMTYDDPSRVWDLKKSPRELLDVHRALQSIEQVEDELWRITRPLKDTNAPGVEIQAAPNSATVAALGKILDSKWKRVAKTVPDLKAIELSGSVGSEGPAKVLSPLEIAHRLQAARRDAVKELLQRQEEEQPVEVDSDFLS